MPIKIPNKQHLSNKTQTLGKKPTPTPEETSLEMYPQGKLKPFIDKLSAIIAPLDEDAHDIHSNIWAQLADTTVFQSAGPKALKGG